MVYHFGLQHSVLGRVLTFILQLITNWLIGDGRSKKIRGIVERPDHHCGNDLVLYVITCSFLLPSNKVIATMVIRPLDDPT